MATMKRIAFILLMELGLLANTGLHAANITVKGSDTLVILAQKWAEAYMAKHPDVKIQVTGGGTGTGFAALQNQTTDICNASRKIKPAESIACVKAFSKRPSEHIVCLDGLAVYVSAANPVKELSLEQIEGIFTGRIKNWKEVGGPDAGIIAYSRENSSGTYEFFKEHVLKGKDFGSSVQNMQGTAVLLQAVAKEANGIGYGGIAYGAGAKHLGIKKDAASPAIEPTESNVLSGAYPIWRNLYLYINPALEKGEIADYIQWIKSDEGQKLVKDVGYFPLPKASN